MTVIAWDGNILAADRMSMSGDTIKSTTKIRKLSNGQVCAYSGDIDSGLALLKWYENGADLKNWPKFQDDKERYAILIIADHNGVFVYERTPFPIPIEDPIAAWGIGREAALGAMEMGADAVKAVDVASKWVTRCGGGCDSFVVLSKIIGGRDYSP